MNKPHRLLQRQLRKVDLDAETLAKIQPMLNQVNAAYLAFENDIEHIEHILEKSSQELFLVNRQLKSSVENISNRLEKVVNNIQEVVFEIDLEGKWVYLNPAWEKLTGFKVKDCIGRHYLDYLKFIDDDSKIKLASIQDGNFKVYNQTFKIETTDGDYKWFDVTLNEIKNSENISDGFIGTIVDISNLKKTEIALIDSREKEKHANKAKDEFLSTMSHEIRTPLNAVIGISHLLLLEDPKEEQLENLNALKYSSEHLLGLVNDILDFNKIESGLLDLESIDFSLDHILNGLQSIFSQKSEEKGIRFIIKKDDALPNVLIGDSVRISQVLTNIINNAIKFTEKGKVLLDIEIEEELENIVNIKFEIKDTGIGIEADKMDKIFESFAQANSNTTRKYGGTGLGLAICKKLLHLMNSSLDVKSKVGKGSTFSFILSLEKSSKSLSRKESYVNTLPSYSGIDGIKILIAEDHKMNIMVIQKFFNKWKIDYEIAENGQIAVDMANDKKYDIILMDLQMPVMNGYDATRLIRDKTTKHNKTIPIYALSASAGIDIKHKVEEYGMNGHISKPFNPSDLYQTLKRIAKDIGLI